MRAWLPLTRLLRRMRGAEESGPYLASHPEMCNWEVYLFGLLFYLTTLAFLAACLLPGLAILPLSEFFAWPVVIVSHVVLLHLSVLIGSLCAALAFPMLKLTGVTRITFQSVFLLGVTTLFAVMLLFAADWVRMVAAGWILFVVVNLGALAVEKLLPRPKSQ